MEMRLSWAFCVYFLVCIGNGPLPSYRTFGEWFNSGGPDSAVSSGGGRSSVEAWYTTTLDIEECLSGIVDVRVCVADDVKCFDAVDRVVLDNVLRSSGLLVWFRHACFEYQHWSGYV